MENTNTVTKEELVTQNQPLIEAWKPWLVGTNEAPLRPNVKPITDGWDSYVMARMLQSAQEAMSRMEDVQTTRVFGTEYMPAILGMIRQVYPSMRSTELIAVQPMDRPTGKVFFLDVKRGDGSSPTWSGDLSTDERTPEDIGAQWDSYRDWASRGENEFIDRDVTLGITSHDIVVNQSRKMKYQYTPELQQDLNAYHGVDASAILQDAAVAELARELDATIVHAINNSVGAGTVTYGTKVPAGYLFSEWRTRLSRAILNASVLIQRRRNLAPTWLLCSTDALVEVLDTQNIDTTGVAPNISGVGLTKVGVLNGMINVFHAPMLSGNQIILGRKGSGFEDAGLIWLPYVLLFLGEKVFDPHYQHWTRSFASRYGLHTVTNKLFSRVVIDPNTSGLS